MANFCSECGNALGHSGASHSSSSKKSAAPKKKRAPSAYNKRYGKAFKSVAPRFKKKNGQWMKDGFKRAGAAARKVAKR
jgi:hypothetical protein